MFFSLIARGFWVASGDIREMADIKGVSIRALQKFFLNKTKTSLNINKIFCSCKSTLDDIMNETQLILHAYHGHACRSPNAEPNF